MESVEFYYDYISPYGYLVNTQLAPRGLPIEFRTISILDVMATVGNQPSPKCPPKMGYALEDTKRWARKYDVPFALNTEWWDAVMSGALNMHLFSAGALVTQRDGGFEAYHHAIWDAIWGRPRDVATPQGRIALLDNAGLSGQEIWEKAAHPDIARQLEAANRQAAARGVFGVPTFFVGDDMFFGNDRLDFVIDRAQRSGIFA